MTQIMLLYLANKLLLLLLLLLLGSLDKLTGILLATSISSSSHRIVSASLIHPAIYKYLPIQSA
jgi:hypothetical protein